MYKLDDIKVGMSASYSQTITDPDIKVFEEISGDKNPVHIDETYAKESRFEKRIAHGMLSPGFFQHYLVLNSRDMVVYMLVKI
jgi:3-hydroxybutyryl-CoA dehydratase